MKPVNHVKKLKTSNGEHVLKWYLPTDYMGSYLYIYFFIGCWEYVTKYYRADYIVQITSFCNC